MDAKLFQEILAKATQITPDLGMAAIMAARKAKTGAQPSEESAVASINDAEPQDGSGQIAALLAARGQKVGPGDTVQNQKGSFSRSNAMIAPWAKTDEELTRELAEREVAAKEGKVQAELAAAQGQDGKEQFPRALDLKKTFQGLEPVRTYGVLKSRYDSAQRAYQDDPLNPINQLDIFKNMAKFQDNSTGVQQGEVDAILSSPSVSSQLKGYIQNIIGKKGKADKGTIDSAMKVIQGYYDSASKDYQGVLKNYQDFGRSQNVPVDTLDLYGGQQGGGQDLSQYTPQQIAYMKSKGML